MIEVKIFAALALAKKKKSTCTRGNAKVQLMNDLYQEGYWDSKRLHRMMFDDFITVFYSH